MTASITTLARDHARLVDKLRRLGPLDDRAQEVLLEHGKGGQLWTLRPHTEAAWQGRATVSEEHLSRVERQLGCRIPDEYRGFLQTVACGGLAGLVPLNDFPDGGRNPGFEVWDFPELRPYDLNDETLSEAWWEEREGGVGFTLWECDGHEAWINFGGNHPGSVWEYDCNTQIHRPTRESFAEYVSRFILHYEEVAEVLLANLPR